MARWQTDGTVFHIIVTQKGAKFTPFLCHNYVKNGAPRLPPGHAWPPLAWQTRVSRSTLLPGPKGLNSTHLYVIII